MCKFKNLKPQQPVAAFEFGNYMYFNFFEQFFEQKIADRWKYTDQATGTKIYHEGGTTLHPAAVQFLCSFFFRATFGS